MQVVLSIARDDLYMSRKKKRKEMITVLQKKETKQNNHLDIVCKKVDVLIQKN